MSAVSSLVQPPEWVRWLTQAVLEDLFDPSALDRGAAYQRRRSVRDVRLGAAGHSVIATVQGSRRYTTVVTCSSPTAGLDPDDFDVLGNCSCPMRVDCKHVVAVILECQARLPTDSSGRSTGPTKPSAPSWEAVLSPVVRGQESLNRVVTEQVPLALLVDVAVARAGQRHTTSPPSAARLQLRPLVPGTNGGWIRTGISWGEVQAPYHWPPMNPEHRAALASILMAERVRSPMYFVPGQWIAGDQLGAGLWRLLEGAVAAGVELRTGRKAERPVVLMASPAGVVLDATRSPVGDIVLRSTLRVPGHTGDPIPLGSPAHGVVISTPERLVLARLDKPLTGPLAALLDESDTVTVPAEDTARFLTHYYPALRQRAQVESSDDSVDFPTVAPPQLAVHVTFEGDHRTRLVWSFRYEVGAAPVDVALHGTNAADPWTGVRDAAAEQALLASLDILDAAPGLRRQALSGTPPTVVATPLLTGWATVAFARDVLPVLQERDDVEVTIVGTLLDYVEADEGPVVTVSTHDIVTPDGAEVDTAQFGSGPQDDWFDLGILVTVGEHEVPLATLLTALARGDDQLILDNGTWFSLDAPALHALRRIVEEARALQDHDSDQLRLNRYQVGMWEELVELGIVAHQSERWSRSVGALLAMDEMPHPEPPASVEATLRHYQLDGYQWLSFLWDLRLGGILADDMGLGKTLQALTMAERARENGSLTPSAPILVVAPTSVVSAWEREAARFTPALTVTSITQTSRKSGVPLADAIAGAHVVVTSYALFRLDAEHYGDREWGALILDEAQFVKNHQSRTYQVARMLPAPVKLAITGTPLENSLMDLWSLLSIVAPGLFPNPARFTELYRRPIESGEAPELLATLRRRIRPLMLRRTKEAVAPELPPKIEQVVAVPLNAAHRRLYDTHLQRERQRILGLLDDDFDRNRIAILSALTKLRQLSLDVHLVEPDAPANIRSSKVDALLEQLVEVVAEGHRCLVFSQFTRFLQIVRARLVAEGIDHVYLDGRTRNRPKRIAEFTDGTAPVFLISLKAGGSGLTLTQADYVFVLDPWWNPAVEAQAVDRTHRIGQDKTVMVYRLVSEGTIEEKVVALQERKRELFSRVVDDGGLMGAALTADDLRGLLDG